MDNAQGLVTSLALKLARVLMRVSPELRVRISFVFNRKYSAWRVKMMRMLSKQASFI
jgi:hypothetical protein